MDSSSASAKNESSPKKIITKENNFYTLNKDKREEIRKRYLDTSRLIFHVCLSNGWTEIDENISIAAAPRNDLKATTSEVLTTNRFSENFPPEESLGSVRSRSQSQNRSQNQRDSRGEYEENNNKRRGSASKKINELSPKIKTENRGGISLNRKNTVGVEVGEIEADVVNVNEAEDPGEEEGARARGSTSEGIINYIEGPKTSDLYAIPNQPKRKERLYSQKSATSVSPPKKSPRTSLIMKELDQLLDALVQEAESIQVKPQNHIYSHTYGRTSNQSQSPTYKNYNYNTHISSPRPDYLENTNNPSIESNDAAVPYHARLDSLPFSYLNDTSAEQIRSPSTSKALRSAPVPIYHEPFHPDHHHPDEGQNSIYSRSAPIPIQRSNSELQKPVSEDPDYWLQKQMERLKLKRENSCRANPGLGLSSSFGSGGGGGGNGFYDSNEFKKKEPPVFLQELKQFNLKQPAFESSNSRSNYQSQQQRHQPNVYIPQSSISPIQNARSNTNNSSLANVRSIPIQRSNSALQTSANYNNSNSSVCSLSSSEEDEELNFSEDATDRTYNLSRGGLKRGENSSSGIGRRIQPQQFQQQQQQQQQNKLRRNYSENIYDRKVIESRENTPSSSNNISKFPLCPPTPYLNRPNTPQFTSSSKKSTNSAMSSPATPADIVQPIYLPSEKVSFARDLSSYWYKPQASREETIRALTHADPGSFIIRNSNSFPGAFGLAVRVREIDASDADNPTSCVRHFLIEPTKFGVRLRGSNIEPVFGSLSALVYSHSIDHLALPIRLKLPNSDTILPLSASVSNTNNLLRQGAACEILFFEIVHIERLNGDEGLNKGLNIILHDHERHISGKQEVFYTYPTPTTISLRLSKNGLTLTDINRRRFFRIHFPLQGISHASLDPRNRSVLYQGKERRLFGIVGRRINCYDNSAIILAELEDGQPADAIVAFFQRVIAWQQQ